MSAKIEYVYLGYKFNQYTKSYWKLAARFLPIIHQKWSKCLKIDEKWSFWRFWLGYCQKSRGMIAMKLCVLICVLSETNIFNFQTPSAIRSALTRKSWFFGYFSMGFPIQIFNPHPPRVIFEIDSWNFAHVIFSYFVIVYALFAIENKKKWKNDTP